MLSMGELRRLGDATRSFAGHLRSLGNRGAADWEDACADACDAEWLHRILGKPLPSPAVHLLPTPQDHT